MRGSKQKEVNKERGGGGGEKRTRSKETIKRLENKEKNRFGDDGTGQRKPDDAS